VGVALSTRTDAPYSAIPDCAEIRTGLSTQYSPLMIGQDLTRALDTGRPSHGSLLGKGAECTAPVLPQDYRTIFFAGNIFCSAGIERIQIRLA
jgi:hypothetical protein